MGKRQISFFIENDVWKKFGMKCVDKETTKTEVLVEAVKKFIKEK